MIDGLRGKVCAVLGAGGFIGRHLVNKLAGQAGELRVFGRNLDALHDAGIASRIEGDFAEQAALEGAIDGADVVFHLVSTTSPVTAEQNRHFDVTTNLLGTLSLLDLCRAHDVPRIIFVSSGGTVYGAVDNQLINEAVLPNPISSYGVTKLAIERYLRLYNRTYGMKNVALRVSNPFGPFQTGRKGQGAIGTFMRAALRNEEITVWGGQAVRDYIYVEDVAAALVAASLYTGSHDLFNVGTGVGRATLDVIADIERIAGRPLRKTVLKQRPFDVAASVLDIGAAVAQLEWRPAADWDKSLRATWAWTLQKG